MDDESLISAVKNGDLADKKYIVVLFEFIVIIEKNVQFFLLGHEHIVSLLIQNGANVSQINDGETALHTAAILGIDFDIQKQQQKALKKAFFINEIAFKMFTKQLLINIYCPVALD